MWVPVDLTTEIGTNARFLDVTDQVQVTDVTEEMRARFESPGFREQLMSGGTGRHNYEYYEDEDDYEDDYEEYDEVKEDL